MICACDAPPPPPARAPPPQPPPPPPVRQPPPPTPAPNPPPPPPPAIAPRTCITVDGPAKGTPCVFPYKFQVGSGGSTHINRD